MRQIIQLEVNDAPLVGTYHSPANGPAEGARAKGGIGILVFNSGYLPRSASGDLSTQLADRLAEQGYHLFRFDMPGLGDSPGTLHEHVLPYFRYVAQGGHVPFATRLAGLLKDRYGLNGLVLLGNCGGAVTAVYSAEKMRDVLGVVQLDPDFELVGAENAALASTVQAKAKIVAKSVRQTLRNRILQSSFGHIVRALYLGFTRFVSSCIRVVREAIFGVRLPPRANLPLLRAWEQLAAAEIPMLLLVADKSNANPGRFDYVRYLMRKRPRKVTQFEVAGTSHSFATGDGKSVVRDQVERWLMVHAPLAGTNHAETPAHINGAATLGTAAAH